MRYMLLVYTDEQGNRTPEQMQAVIDGHRAAMAEATRRGYFCGAEPLFPTSAATTVRQREGKPLLTDGPFAETKEQLAGYYILDCDNLDQALEIAAMVPTGCGGAGGCVEVRPIRAMPTSAAEVLATQEANA